MHHERSKGLMPEVHAVFDEIQAALDVRSYYHMRLRRFEASIIPETPNDPNELARPIIDPACGEKTEAKPERESQASKETSQVSRGAPTTGTTATCRR
jgi:hypothetical protein